MQGLRDRTVTAIFIMLDIAFHGMHGNTVSATEIAQRSGMARRGIEPLLQVLSRSGLLSGVRGPHGGYRLGHPAREILLSDIHQAIMARHDRMERRNGPLFNTVIRPFLNQMEGMLEREYRKVTLDELVRQAENHGLPRPERPPAQPATFSI
ncbi:Rrf2 family transcriptional regulator [Novacetimonas hansenii]|uniref:Rrf2 family transcriptional regulator n=2 Tax=Novacetimonas hansenii TaxID=436 RepID=A0AAW5ESD8_NOVHA|nr:Rrf2 family transcriptional regulator [Novacetimonas hansenii]EFG83058.1 transcriptional regulator, BadM/Rrf2 family protein [Novacetimonas hansenii ATCC 23769]MBL7235307.1 Rrf2 family transcriptional regulator [Novacetimonas hansenii]MCJ8354225.1 Rrf2 family transcriptional regulator [Novacetimonas hansenii]PYD73395.1 Rrf2 family transcriptional regulator [Novacetimonas hansenii]QOF95680.1 Rrf2 family transcriptional regulator [Novacetimonas hansenii]